MDWIDLIGGGALGAILVKLIDHYFTRPKTQAEAGVLRSEASENITEAAQTAANVLVQSLTYKQAENREYQERVKALEAAQEKSDGLIRELQSHRDERTRQIADLTESNEALNAQVAALRAQIARDTAETRELARKYNELKEFTRLLLSFLKEKGVDLNGIHDKIPDSVHKWNWPK